MKRILIEVLKQAAWLAFFIFAIQTFIGHIEEYQEFNQNKDEMIEQTILDKGARQDLFSSGVRYYLILEDFGALRKATPNIEGHHITYLSKQDWDESKVGSRISGYTLDGRYADKGDIRDTRETYYLWFVMSIAVMIGYLLFLCTRVKRWRELAITIASFAFAIPFTIGVVIVLGIGLYSYGKVGWGITEKMISDQEETNAIVMDHGFIEGSSGRYPTSPVYYLALMYKTNEGEYVNISREVPHSIYKAYENGDKIEIYYNVNKSHYAYIQDLRFIDILSIMYSTDFFLVCLMTIIILLLIITVILMRQQKKYGSYKGLGISKYFKNLKMKFKWRRR